MIVKDILTEEQMRNLFERSEAKPVEESLSSDNPLEEMDVEMEDLDM